LYYYTFTEKISHYKQGYFAYKIFVQREIVVAQNFAPVRRIMKQCLYFIIWGVCCNKKQFVSQWIVLYRETVGRTPYRQGMPCLYKFIHTNNNLQFNKFHVNKFK